MKRKLSLIASLVGIVAGLGGLGITAYVFISLATSAPTAMLALLQHLYQVPALLVCSGFTFTFSLRALKNRNADKYNMVKPIAAAVFAVVGAVFGFWGYTFFADWTGIVILIVSIALVAAAVVYVVDIVLATRKNAQPQQPQNPEQPQA